jgi:hypothetical protein
MSNPDFHPSIDELAPRVLHGQADESEQAELGRLLAESPENRRRFLEHTALHGLLAQAARAGALAENPEDHFRRMEEGPPKNTKRILRFWMPAAAAAIAACLTVVALLPMTATAALDRVVAAMEKAVDRTYQIEVLDPGNNTATGSHADRGRFPIAAHLDGATLWLRGTDQFVLRQSLPTGETRILGSDATESWSIRGNGAVHIDHDPDRFGGGLGTKRREVAFLDPGPQLEELKRLYQIEWLDRPAAGPWKLRGLRRSPDQGGAREIELWFDHATGLLERMILRQLPRQQGGPESVSIRLSSTAPLAPDFFNHAAHHEPDRPVINDPSKTK